MCVNFRMQDIVVCPFTAIHYNDDNGGIQSLRLRYNGDIFGQFYYFIFNYRNK
jgi:hypothetical protein